MDPIEALQQALAAEHAVIWGYGVVGAHVLVDQRAPVARAQDAHVGRREEAAARLRADNVVPGQPEAAYELPYDVTDAATALRLATDLEDGAGRAWCYLLGQTDDAELRGFALDALTAAAVQAVRWRLAAGVSPATVALPGLG